MGQDDLDAEVGAFDRVDFVNFAIECLTGRAKDAAYELANCSGGEKRLKWKRKFIDAKNSVGNVSRNAKW